MLFVLNAWDAGIGCFASNAPSFTVAWLLPQPDSVVMNNTPALMAANVRLMILLIPGSPLSLPV